MAFEDRCSPSQANSPGPVPSGDPSSNTTTPNPNDRSLKPYTCSTITSKYERTPSPSPRTSPSIVYVKAQPVSPVPSPVLSPVDPVHLQMAPHPAYNPYFNPYIVNHLAFHPDYARSYHSSILPPPELSKLYMHQSVSLKFQQDAVQRKALEKHCEIDATEDKDLNFSISNILRPEFGLLALKKTTNKKEGPKPGGPTQSILYKPYDLNKNAVEIRSTPKNEYIRAPSVSSDWGKTAPLGNLCNTVAQIGSKSHKSTLAEHARAPGSFGASKEDFSRMEPSSRRPDSANSSISTSSSTVSSQGVQNGAANGYATGSDDGNASKNGSSAEKQWPAWVYCTRYSDRPSSGPRSRRAKKPKAVVVPQQGPVNAEDKRPRTAFSGSQLARLKHEFAENRYLTERRRQQLSAELGLNEAQIKIWFQNKRAKIKKASGQKNPLALQLMAQGLYNHATASCSEGEDDDVSVA